MKKSNVLLLTLLVISSLLIRSCDLIDSFLNNNGLDGTVEVSVNITESETWSADNVYVIEGNVSVSEGAILTIEPGTTIKFNSGGGLILGYSDNSTIIARGTKEKPITFTSSASNPAAGSWEGLTFYSNTSQNSIFRNCIIEYAGQNSYGALEILGCDISMDSCIIADCSTSAIYATYSDNKGGFISFTNNSIIDCDGYALEMNANKISGIDISNTFENVDGVLITGSYNTPTMQTWNKLEVPYILDQDISINGALTLQAGTVYKFEVNGGMTFGYNSSTTLIADGGSSETPIIFTSNAVAPTAGSWIGLTFYSNSLSSSVMSNCIVEYAGSNTIAAIRQYGNSLTFTNNTITNSSSGGIYYNQDAGAVAFHHNTINSCAGHLISIHTRYLPDLGTPNSMIAGTLKGIEIRESTTYSTAVTWKKQEAEFYTEDNISINGDLTLEAGTVIHFGSNAGFSTGYNSSSRLTAVGTSSSPIVFTSSAAVPAAGAWGGLYFWNNTLSNTVLDYCIIEYAGRNSTAPINTDANMTVSNSQINNSNNQALKHNTVTVSGTGNNFSWSDK